MWKCSVCGQENPRMVCGKCGQWECEDILTLRSLTPLTELDVAKYEERVFEWRGRPRRRTKDGGKKNTLLFAAVAALAIVCGIGVGIGFGAGSRQNGELPQEPPVMAQSLPETTLPEETIPPAAPETQPPTAAETRAPEAVPPTQAPTEEPIPPDNWKNNLLQEDDIYEVGGRVFDSSLKREDVSAITFLDTLKNAPKHTIDVSQDRDGSVLAWTEADGKLEHLYIAAEGGMTAPKNCRGLFCGYTNARSIEFNGSFHTDGATTMSYMFSHCESLEWLDVSDFDTSDVTRMECMFMHCYALTELDLSSFNILKVRDMGSIFWGCRNLEALDLSTFVATDRNVQYWNEGCTKLKTVIWPS